MLHNRPSSRIAGIKLDADRAKILLDDERLDRIINAVGKTLIKPNRDALRLDLLNCNHLYSIASVRPGLLRAQINRLNSIQKHAKQLVDLLKADDDDMGIIRMGWPISPERPAHLLPQMVFLVEMIDQMPGVHGKPADIAARTKARLGISSSPLQSLTGMWLPAVYKTHFGKDAGISRNQRGVPGGPYMRFAHQALVEFEIECSDETVAGALHMVKS